MFWNFVLGVAARTRLHVPVEFEDSSRSNCFQESELWAFSCRPFGFWILGDPHKSPSACMITLSFIVVPRIDQMSHVVRKIFLRAPRLRNTKLTDFAFAGTVGLGFAIGEPSLEVASWTLLTWRSAFPIGSERKMLKCLQENIEKLIMLNRRRRWSHSSREKLLWLECQQVGFWCQHIWFGPWVQNWFCRTTNQAQLCGFLTRVSSSDFVL